MHLFCCYAADDSDALLVAEHLKAVTVCSASHMLQLHMPLVCPTLVLWLYELLKSNKLF
jgi:hypothetical protein